jgi:hypothetical protein
MAKANNHSTDWTLTIKLERGVKAGATKGHKVPLSTVAGMAGNIIANSLSRLPAAARVQLDYEIDGQSN